jgi:serine/threonine protein kinase
VVKAADKFETEGLAREIYHHRRLRHPYITRLYEVIHTEKNVWLVLEYCHGKSPSSPTTLPALTVNRRRIIRFSPQTEAVKGTCCSKDVFSTRRRGSVYPQIGMRSSRLEIGEYPTRQE